MSRGFAELRRFPRLPSRCRAYVRDRYGVWDAETEDVSQRGCRIVTPRPQTVGRLVRLTLSSDRLGEPLVVTGQVVWVSPGRPARAGISFTGSPTDAPGPGPWMKSLAAAELGRAQDAAPGVTVVLPAAAELDVLIAPPEPEDAAPEALAARLADRAEELLDADRPGEAAMILRRALAFAPGDARIASLLARAAAA